MSDAQASLCPPVLLWIVRPILGMMKRGILVKFWLYSSLIFALALPTYASGRTSFTIMGVRDCKTWTEDQKSVAAGKDFARLIGSGNISWVLGFLSALNYVDDETDVLGAIDSDTVEEWVGQYCSQHPDDDTADAAIKLFIKLKKVAR
jgi:hypothetical protein